MGSSMNDEGRVRRHGALPSVEKETRNDQSRFALRRQPKKTDRYVPEYRGPPGEVIEEEWSTGEDEEEEEEEEEDEEEGETDEEEVVGGSPHEEQESGRGKSRRFSLRRNPKVTDRYEPEVPSPRGTRQRQRKESKAIEDKHKMKRRKIREGQTTGPEELRNLDLSREKRVPENRRKDVSTMQGEKEEQLTARTSSPSPAPSSSPPSSSCQTSASVSVARYSISELQGLVRAQIILLREREVDLSRCRHENASLTAELKILRRDLEQREATIFLLQDDLNRVRGKQRQGKIHKAQGRQGIARETLDDTSGKTRERFLFPFGLRRSSIFQRDEPHYS